MENIIELFSFNDATPYNIAYSDSVYHLTWQNIGYTIKSVKSRSNQGVTWFELGDIEDDGLYINFSRNNTPQEREAQILINVESDNTGFKDTFIFTIVQAKGKPLFTLPQDTLNIDYSVTATTSDIIFDDVKTLTVTSNVDWLSASITYNGKISKLNINSTRNELNEQRNGILTLSYQSQYVSYQTKLTVIQSANDNAAKILFEDSVVKISPDNTYNTTVRYSLLNGSRIVSYVTDGDFYTVSFQTAGEAVFTPTKINNTLNKNTDTLLINIENDYGINTYELTVEQERAFDFIFNPMFVDYDYNGKEKATYNAILDTRGYEIESGEVVEQSTDPFYTVTWNNEERKVTFSNVIPNQSQEPKTDRIKLKFVVNYDDGLTAETYSIIDINQDGSPEYIESPIWKDTFITLNKELYGNYRLYRFFNIDTQEEIFRGQLLFINDTIEININDIAKDYFNINKYPFNNIWTNNNGYVNILFEMSSNMNDFDTIRLYHLYYNYDYDYDTFEYDLKESNITNPIQDYVDNRQYFIWSFQDYYNSAINTANTTPIFIDYQYTNTLRQDSFTIGNAQNTLCFKASYPLEKVTITTNITKEINVKETCFDYCLYYINRQGGWSWLLIDGNSVKSNKIQTYSYNRTRNNTLPSNFENTQYLKNINEEWKLNTDYLNDDQSEKMFDVLTSPTMYLHNLNTDRLIAVTIDETTVEKKEFKNLKKPFQYSFTVYNSQIKERR